MRQQRIGKEKKSSKGVRRLGAFCLSCWKESKQFKLCTADLLFSILKVQIIKSGKLYIKIKMLCIDLSWIYSLVLRSAKSFTSRKILFFGVWPKFSKFTRNASGRVLLSCSWACSQTENKSNLEPLGCGNRIGNGVVSSDAAWSRPAS